MQVKSILNAIEKHASFVYRRVSWAGTPGKSALLVEVAPRANGRAVCSGCGKKRPGYDVLAARKFEYVPLWALSVYFVYAMRRVNCPTCGVVVEAVPWAEGKSRMTRSYMWFLARWAKRLSWAEVACIFKTSWQSVYRAVAMAVHWGLEHRVLDGVVAIGVDEVLWKRGHKYLTVVYQIDEGCKRLLWVGKDRTEESFRQFFAVLSDVQRLGVRFVCSDMWRPYLKVIAEKLGHALNILDRYHIASTMNKAVDEVRAKEVKDLRAKGLEPVLKHSRWCLLKRPENLTEAQETKLADLVRYNLKSVRAYLLKETFQNFWEYVSPAWAGKFLDRWCKKTMRSRIEPMKKVVRTLRSHRDLLLNWFKARGVISMGAVEGLNNKLKLTTRKSYGFRTFKVAETALFHALGDLPEPKDTHKFC